MSYLAALRLHFAGQFQAAPSTVNNDPAHFDNATFKPEYQLPGQTRGWWNPRGNADWRLIGCTVRSAFYGDGTPAATDDPVLGMLVADSDRQVAGKLVDLDPEQQLVSQIFGLEVRICDALGSTLVGGRFVPAPFVDIWDRAHGPGAQGDIGACAAYQSILTELEWGDVEGSRWLTELREAATDGLLSIRFNVDGYNMSMGSPDFTRGRIAGTIGPASRAEPRHFVPGRQFMARPGPQANFFSPIGAINFCTAVVDAARGRVVVDLGNALPTAGPGGPPVALGELTLGYLAPGDSEPTPLGTIDYLAEDWYERTAGVVEIALDGGSLAAIEEARLALSLSTVQTPTLESPGGLYVRADDFVARLDPGDTAQVRLFATRYGRPYAGAQIVAKDDPSGLQSQGDPTAGEPAGGISHAQGSFAAGDDGTAMLQITAGDPGRPRDYIDGQLYGVRPALADQPVDYPTDPWNFISVLVFDAFTPTEPITWWPTLQPIFQQYANLYPVMDLFLDLADYDSVGENAELLSLAFGLDEHDPNAMPVTRDLSRAKRAAILRWLEQPGEDGKPLLGTPPPQRVTAPGRLQPAIVPPDLSPEPGRGGKAAAAARRRVIPGSETEGAGS